MTTEMRLEDAHAHRALGGLSCLPSHGVIVSVSRSSDATVPPYVCTATSAAPTHVLRCDGGNMVLRAIQRLVRSLSLSLASSSHALATLCTDTPGGSRDGTKHKEEQESRHQGV
jgi:hypothetical protein